jgi:hypothetical protein
MKTFNAKAMVIISVLLLNLCGTARADLDADLVPLPAFQVGTEGVISFGTIVTAHTNLNAL